MIIDVCCFSKHAHLWARVASYHVSLVSLSAEESFGNREVKQSPTVGIEHTFYGLCIMAGDVTVNYSIRSSFNPAKLVCISCGKSMKLLAIVIEQIVTFFLTSR
jgi:hypothetical protein